MVPKLAPVNTSPVPLTIDNVVPVGLFRLLVNVALPVEPAIVTVCPVVMDWLGRLAKSTS